jgi:putative ABC transport system substrate-binding protein
MELAIKEFAGQRNGGLVVTPDVMTHNNRTVIFSLAARYQLPAVYGYLFYVAEGGFAAYGIDTVDLYKQAAGYVDRILRGEKPDQLAIQAPTKLELAINLKTAKTLGITVPRTLVSRADKVIE